MGGAPGRCQRLLGDRRTCAWLRRPPPASRRPGERGPPALSLSLSLLRPESGRRLAPSVRARLLRFPRASSARRQLQAGRAAPAGKRATRAREGGGGSGASPAQPALAPAPSAVSARGRRKKEGGTAGVGVPSAGLAGGRGPPAPRRAKGLPPPPPPQVGVVLEALFRTDWGEGWRSCKTNKAWWHLVACATLSWLVVHLYRQTGRGDYFETSMHTWESGVGVSAPLLQVRICALNIHVHPRKGATNLAR